MKAFRDYLELVFCFIYIAIWSISLTVILPKYLLWIMVIVSTVLIFTDDNRAYNQGFIYNTPTVKTIFISIVLFFAMSSLGGLVFGKEPVDYIKDGNFAFFLMITGIIGRMDYLIKKLSFLKKIESES